MDRAIRPTNPLYGVHRGVRMLNAANWLAKRFSNGALEEAGPERVETGPKYNEALAYLKRKQGMRTREDFDLQIEPMYQVLMAGLRETMDSAAAEDAVAHIIYDTACACIRRWSGRLPQKRPGTDYRRYEFIYTDALVTAMAVEGYLRAKQGEDDVPQLLAERLVPAAVLSEMQADPMVWEDWLGYFEQSPLGGLYAMAHEAPREPDLSALEPVAPVRPPDLPERPAEADSPRRSKAAGWDVVDGIRKCLEDGTLPFNEPGNLVQIDREGRTFLRSPAAFEEVKKLLGWEEDTKRLVNQFARLKIGKQVREGRDLFKGRSLRSESWVEGHVIEQSNVFWNDNAPEGRFVIKDVTHTA